MSICLHEAETKPGSTANASRNRRAKENPRTREGESSRQSTRWRNRDEIICESRKHQSRTSRVQCGETPLPNDLFLCTSALDVSPFVCCTISPTPVATFQRTVEAGTWENGFMRTNHPQPMQSRGTPKASSKLKAAAESPTESNPSKVAPTPAQNLSSASPWHLES